MGPRSPGARQTGCHTILAKWTGGIPIVLLGSVVVAFGVTSMKMVERALFSSRTVSAFGDAPDQTEDAIGIICANSICIVCL